MSGTERQYAVEGMSCDRCVQAVSDSVQGVDGVGSVDVDLGSGTVTVSGDAIDDGAVRGAIEDAGYQPA